MCPLTNISQLLILFHSRYTPLAHACILPQAFTRLHSTVLLRKPTFFPSFIFVFLHNLIHSIFHAIYMCMVPKCSSPDPKCPLSSRLTDVNSCFPALKFVPSVFLISATGLPTCSHQKPKIHSSLLLNHQIQTGQHLKSSKLTHLFSLLLIFPLVNH